MLGVLGVRVVKGTRFVPVSCLCHVALQVTHYSLVRQYRAMINHPKLSP